MGALKQKFRQKRKSAEDSGCNPRDPKKDRQDPRDDGDRGGRNSPAVLPLTAVAVIGLTCFLGVAVGAAYGGAELEASSEQFSAVYQRLG